MCEYCHCLGNNHAAGCPLNEEPEEYKRLTCCECGTLLWSDEDEDFLAFPNDNGTDDIVCNDCLRNYLIGHNIAGYIRV